MGNFLKSDFWFSVRPGAFISSSLRLILGFIALLIILTIAASIGRKNGQKAYTPVFGKAFIIFFFTNATIGLVLTFFNYEMVPFLSARFWFLLWGASMIVWLFFIYKIIIKIPQKKQQLEKEKEFKKYIP